MTDAEDYRRGWGALLPLPFWLGALVTLGVLTLMAWWSKGSNFLVEAGIFVSSKKEHLLTLPGIFHGVGITPRTIMALLGVIFVVGGLCVLVDSLRTGAAPDMDAIPPPPPQPQAQPQDQPQMGNWLPPGFPAGGMMIPMGMTQPPMVQQPPPNQD